MVDVLLIALRVGVIALGLFMAGGTLLSLSRHPHWFIRGWDFPRVLIGAFAIFAGATYALVPFGPETWTLWEIAFLVAVGACVAWQAYKIYPYTPLASKAVQRAERPPDGRSLRLVASNVEMENDMHDRWLEVVRDADPDLILALEVNERWMQHIEVLEEDYPHVVREPQDNYYGMVLFSRYEILDHEVRFIVQDDVPSIRVEVQLPCGQTIYMHGVHPRPPEPLRDQDSTPRDAEVVLLAREIDEQEEQRPTIIAGDFNDVAWSHTSELFQRLSQLLDPRRGRGLYNSFDAKNPIFRFPLDHVFHSNHFKLLNLKLLDYVGSDHFPVFIELSYEPDAPVEQGKPDAAPGEQEEADDKVERATEEVENDTLPDEEVPDDARAATDEHKPS